MRGFWIRQSRLMLAVKGIKGIVYIASHPMDTLWNAVPPPDACDALGATSPFPFALGGGLVLSSALARWLAEDGPTRAWVEAAMRDSRVATEAARAAGAEAGGGGAHRGWEACPVLHEAETRRGVNARCEAFACMHVCFLRVLEIVAPPQFAQNASHTLHYSAPKSTSPPCAPAAIPPSYSPGSAARS